MALKPISKYWITFLILIATLNTFGQYRGETDSLLKPFNNYSFLHKKDLKKKENVFSPLGPNAQFLRTTSYKNLNNIDKRGLWIKLKEKEFLYKDEKIYELTESKCELKEVDGKKSGRYLRKVLNSLNSLYTKSPYAKNIIKTLQESENKFTIAIVNAIDSYTLVPIPGNRFGVLNNNAYAFQIMEQKENIVDYAPFNQIGSGAEIRWSSRHKKMHLAHELAHAYDANFGLLDDRLVQAYGMIIPAREVRALFHENMIRRELHKKLRIDLKNGSSALVANGIPYTIPLPFPARS